MKKPRTVIISLLIAVILPTLQVRAAALPDDISGHWAEETIIWNIEHDYMSGTGNNKFSPNRTVTRAQIVQVLYNMNDRPNTEVDHPFIDARGHWAENAIKWAYEHGIVAGKSSTSFDPNGPITKEQAVTIFHRYAYKNLSNPKPDVTIDLTYLDRHTDNDSISTWARNSMAWGLQYGLIQGSGGKLDPRKPLTRAHLAQMIRNYFEPIRTPAETPLQTDIQRIIDGTDLTEQTKYFDACDSTVLEREVMLLLTEVKFKYLSPMQSRPKYLNELWYDPRYVAKTTMSEMVKERTDSTDRMKRHTNAKDYFDSIYKERNLHNANYVDSFWYHIVDLPPDESAKGIAKRLLQDQGFQQKLKTSNFTFYGIYIDSANGLCCVAHGNASAGPR